MIPKFQRYYEVIVRFAKMMTQQYVDDDCQGTAAALTYQTLFAVVPLLTVMYAIFNTFEAFEGVAGRAEEFIFNNVIPENVSVVQEYLNSFSDQALNLSIPSVMLLGVTAFMMLFTIERTFNDIWRVKDPRHGFQRFLMYWAILTMGPFLMGFGFAISTYVVSLPLISGVTESTGVLKFVPFLLSSSLFTMIYVAVPNCVVPLRNAMVGGVLVAIAFEMAKWGFANFMAESNFEVIYGTFAAVPLFLLWIYLSWTIVLMGAEVVKGLSVFRPAGDEHIESPLVQMLLILELFFRAHRRGKVVRDDDVRKLTDRIEASEWNALKGRLMDLNLIKSLDRGGIVLSQDLKEVTLWDLYQKVPFDMPQTIGGGESWEKDLAAKLEKITSRSQEYLNMDLETLFESALPPRGATAKDSPGAATS